MNLYVLKHTHDETELCMLEKKTLFNIECTENYFFVPNYIDVDRSPFVKYCLRNVILSDSLEGLLEIIRNENISYESFKIKYLDIDGSIEFNKRHEIEGIIGYEINGLAKVNTPSIVIGITRLEGKWILGEYLKNSAVWYKHTIRPQEYCNALTTRVSRAIVNIAVGNDKDKKIIDPCCGIGTVVMEALSMGMNIVGSDINEKVARGAARNLEYFDYPPVIKQGNIHEIRDHYDIVIVDLPYGILSITSKMNQIEIVRSAKRIGDKIALVSVEDMEEELLTIGFKIKEKCVIAKGKFKRKLYILIHN